MRITLIVIGCLVAVLLLLALYSPSTPAPHTATRANLKRLYYTIDVLHRDAPEIWSAMMVATNPIDGARLKGFFLSQKAKLEPLQFSDIERMMVDGWGRPFNVSKRVDLVAHEPTPALLGGSADVVVWSSGKDGTNDYGRGDDVVYTRDR